MMGEKHCKKKRKKKANSIKLEFSKCLELSSKTDNEIWKKINLGVYWLLQTYRSLTGLEEIKMSKVQEKWVSTSLFTLKKKLRKSFL